MADSSPAPAPAAPPNPIDIIRSKSYLVLLVLGGAIGVPVAVVAYYFLTAVSKLQTAIFTTLPKDAGYHSMPSWWPVPWLILSGFLVAASIRFLPGTSGHEPSEGFQTGGGPLPPIELFGVIAAALASLALGAVIGPEAPLIAIGSGLGALAIHLVKRDAPQMAVVVIAAAGSFAAISTLLGSPLVGAFLLMEATGLGGVMMETVLIPGLLAAGIGALVFIGLGTLTGLGTFSLTISPIPPLGAPTAAEFGWALVIGVGSAFIAAGVFHVARALRRIVEPRRFLVTPLLGLGVAGLAAAFAAGTGRSAGAVLFSGQSALPTLVATAAGWSVGALVLLLVCKACAYSLSLSGFRGGPIFPAMFIGAAGGIALSHAGGLPMIAGVGMGIAAMTAAALRLPMVAVVLPALLLAPDAVNLIPLLIVASISAFVTSVHLLPRAVPAPGPRAGSRARHLIGPLVVPTSYLSYFTATATAAGALIGLLFVAVSLRADSVFGPDAPARGRVLAMSSFTALANAFFLSILAIVPQVNVGYPAVVLAISSLTNTARLHRQLRGQDPQYVTLAVSLGAYVSELGLGIALIVEPHATGPVNWLCYVVVAEFVAALSRAWNLIQGAHLQTSPPRVHPE